MGDYNFLKLQVNEGVAWILMNRPDAMNSLNQPMKVELLDALSKIEADESVRCVIMTGIGRAFSTGEDIKEMVAKIQKKEEFSLSGILRQYYHPIARKLVLMEKPVVASINGVAAGAGLSLALASDYRIASEAASFLSAFIKVGLVPDTGANFFLPRLVGLAKALELSLLSERIDATEALRIGLVNRVVPAENLEQESRKIASKFASLPTKTVALIKHAMMVSFDQTLDQALDYEAELQEVAGKSEDFSEGLRAFSEKRQPTFRGK